MDITYGTTKDGKLGATVGSSTYVLSSLRDGSIGFRTSYKTLPIEELTSDDLFMFETLDGGEDAFRAEMEDIALHLDQVAQLGRVDHNSRANTFWGPAQGGQTYTRGINYYSTASHGGFKVSPTLNAKIPEPYRQDNGWYEHSVESACIVAAFPALFTEREQRQAEDRLINWKPDQWEQVNGRTISEGQSYIRDGQIFAERHKDDLVVISAVSSSHPDRKGMVECVATKGGVRGGWRDGIVHSPEKILLLVPSDEYNQGPRGYGFIADPERHAHPDNVSQLAPRR